MGRSQNEVCIQGGRQTLNDRTADSAFDESETWLSAQRHGSEHTAVRVARWRKIRHTKDPVLNRLKAHFIEGLGLPSSNHLEHSLGYSWYLRLFIAKRLRFCECSLIDLAAFLAVPQTAQMFANSSSAHPSLLRQIHAHICIPND